MKMLVAGIGNIFLGDDGFGVEVARRLAAAPVPDGVVVADYGIRGVHLALELLEGYDALVLVDALEVGEAPGTVVVFEPETDLVEGTVVDAHSMDPAVVLGMLGAMGGRVERVLVVGCQPAGLVEGIGLSPSVAAAVDRAAEATLEAVARLMVPDEERSQL
jgi:hydrogenase maturation protease